MEHALSRLLNARSRRNVLRLAGAAVVLSSGATWAASFNDTGQTACYSATGTAEPCSTESEDGRFGRDAAAAAGALSKTGAGVAGFDFTKIANNGGDLGAGAALGSNPGDWACTRDNVTGLTWEIKTNISITDLRDQAHQYTWYSTAPNNGGDAGTVGDGAWCHDTLATCNTTSYILAVNATNLCGYTDWRLPTLRELEGLVAFGPLDPVIDPTYFPNTLTYSWYWTVTVYAVTPTTATDSWVVNFSGGQGGNTSNTAQSKSSGAFIRLVRGGQ